VADPLVYLDANVFIYALEADAARRQPIQSLLLALREHPGAAITSELTLAEVLVKPEKDRNFDLKRRYLELLVWSSAVELRPLSRNVLIESAQYRAVAFPEQPDPREDRRNFLPDAIHIVTAVQGRCRYFLANDTRLRLPAGMTRLSADPDGIGGLMESFG
jgi:predicted nucleic acid-binding protein